MIRLLFLLPLVAACATDQTPAWAVEHGNVAASDDLGAIDGYQIWEFYNAAWSSSQDDADHVCSRVQTLSGAAESSFPTGCPGCVASYALTLTELETDCTGDEATDATYSGTTRYAIGAVSNQLVDNDPHPGDSQGWYGGWGGSEVETLGFAWNSLLDQGDTPELEGWNGGQSYTLSAGFVWDLSAG